MIDVPAVIMPKTRAFPLEKAVEKELVKQVKAMGGDSSKFSSPNNRGVFDQIVMTPDGSTHYVEVKAEKGKPSHKQAVYATRLEKQSQSWCYVYGMTGVKEFMVDLIAGNTLNRIYHEPKRRKAIAHIIEG